LLRTAGRQPDAPPGDLDRHRRRMDLGEMVKLTVVHDGFEDGSAVFR
jgi:hypothetical protein